jgi:hypothetical protein
MAIAAVERRTKQARVRIEYCTSLIGKTLLGLKVGVGNMSGWGVLRVFTSEWRKPGDWQWTFTGNWSIIFKLATHIKQRQIRKWTNFGDLRRKNPRLC